jgi:hypothetical protein
MKLDATRGGEEMRMKKFIATGVLLLSAAAALGQIAPEGDPVASRTHAAPGLAFVNVHQPLSKLPADLAARLQGQITALGISGAYASYDLRAGRFGTLAPGKPLVPGSGVGNSLTWAALGGTAPASDAAYEQAAWLAFRSWLAANRAILGIDTAELGTPVLSSYEGRRLLHMSANRVAGGVPVRTSFVQATVNSGNLVLYGSYNWGAIDASTTPAISAEQAKAAVASHLSGFSADLSGRPELVLVPFANGDATPANEGRGYTYRLAWEFHPEVRGSVGGWEAFVDAQSGELLAFHDRAQYLDQKKVVGGIFPLSNDGNSPNGIPDGVEQPGHPMGHAYVLDSEGNQLEANSEGLVSVEGQYSTALAGPFLRIQETCGTPDESTLCSALDLGTSAGTDCAVPAGHSAGDTHAGRTGFYELNRVMDQAKSWLGPEAHATSPAGWLNRQLPANMNVDLTCNANFNPINLDDPAAGIMNFFKSGPHAVNPTTVCRNTGEIAAVFDHEWGHGLDSFDNSAGVSMPGEAYADMTAIHRLNKSCIGRGFYAANSRGGVCPGDGDVCTECSGVREADWKKRQSGKPHDISWVLGQHPTIPGSCPVSPVSTSPISPTPFNSGPCLRNTHCEGSIITEAVWDLLKRDLPCHGARWESYPGGAVYGGRCTAGAATTIDERSAQVLGTRLFYLASNGITLGYQCDPSIGGCTAGSWYLNYLAADDDDGLLANGTPHMVAINDAFVRHGLACPPQAPPAGVLNFGCVATPAPTAKSTVTATAGVRSATITWTPVAGAGEYWVLRTDGVHGCDMGKTRVAQVSATAPLTFTQTDLLDGLTYYYSVVGVGGAGGVGLDACAGAMSDCASVTPLAPDGASGPALALSRKGAPVIETGDGDPFVDNCETARIDLDVINGGSVGLTGIRITAIQPSSGETRVLTPLPIVVANLPNGCGAADSRTPAAFRFTAGGLASQSTLAFQVTITANELPAPLTVTVTVEEAETDWTLGNVTYGFESDTQGWTVKSGTFTRTNTGGGANGPQSYYMASSTADDSACDDVRSPRMILTGSSTMSLSNQFATEPESQGFFYDRANVGLIDETTGSRTVISPDGGRTYNASGGNPDDNACTNLEGGWASAGPAWMESTWSPTALGAADFAGMPVRLSVRNGTDSITSLVGFWFDEVRLTNVLLAGPDSQPNVCNRPPDAVNDAATTAMNTPVTIAVLANDTDPDGDALAITAVGDSPHGAAGANANGTVTYTPDAGFFGADSFTYTVSDGRGGSDTATVAVTVQAPDLQVANVVASSAKPKEGDRVTVTATISNNGTAPAGASKTEFLLDGATVLGLVDTVAIPAGGSVSVSVPWDTRGVKGEHVIRVTADRAAAVIESSEGNNVGNFTVTIQGNKVQNGSFEQASSSGSGPEGWSGSSTGAGSASWSEGGSDGSKSASTSGNGGSAATSGSPSWTSAPIAVVPGEVLTLAVSVQALGASSAASAGLVYLGSAGQVLSSVTVLTAPLTTSGFARLQQLVTVPAGVSQVRVKLVGFAPTDRRTSGTIRFDDVGLFGN